MSFSGGVYTLPGPALATGEVVSATENNQFRNDVAGAFNLTFLRNGTSTATANLPMGGYKLTGLGVATTSGDALSYGQAAVVSDITATGSITVNSGTANGVAYLNGSKVLTTGSALTFNGTNFGVGTTSPTGKLQATATSAANLILENTTASTGKMWQINSSSGGVLNFGVYGVDDYMFLTSTGLGIGTSSPSQKLSVNGGVIILGGNLLRLAGPANTQVGYIQSTSDNSGSIAFGTESTETMRLTNGGNLGLGVTPSAWNSPFKAFQSQNCSVAFQTNANVMRLMNNNYYNGSNYVYTSSSAASQFNLKETGAFEWQIASSGTAGNAITFTQAMTLDASGNLGIGTSSPGYKLDINGSQGFSYGNSLYSKTSGGSNASFLGYKTVNSESNLTYLENPWHAVVIATGTSGTSTERMRIDSSGNVGIGTSSPASKLHVYSSGQLAVVESSGNYGTSGSGYIRWKDVNGNAAFVGYGGNANNFDVYNPLAGALTFSTNASERMRIDSSGNLLVGKTTTSSTGVGHVFTLGGTWQTSSAGTAFYYAALFYNNGGSTNVGSITTSGSTTSYATSSDYRLKENVKPMQNALATVAQLNPVTYTWKADGSDGQGFIAHELQAVVPDCVTGEKDAVDEEGKPVYQGIDTSFLVATLTKAIQELKAELDATKAEIAALKGN